MRHLLKKNKEIIKRILIYIGMVLTVVVSVIFVTFLVLGFRFDLGNGEIQQYAFLRFSSVPSGATVSVDGQQVSSRTPNRGSVKAGRHGVTMQKNGYETWAKTIDIAAGTLKWLNYIIFVPSTLTTESISDYPELYSSIPMPKGRGMLIQPRIDVPSFDIIDFGSEKPKTTNIILPADLYSDSAIVGVAHTFEVQNWDDGSRYILVKHTFSGKYEWLLVDTQSVNLSKNITKVFDIQIDDIDFAGSNGDYFFILESGDIRKLDLSLSTISRTLVSGVASMKINGSNIVAFDGKDESGNQIIGTYRDGDETAFTVKSFDDAPSLPTKVASFHYFNEDYLAYSIGRTVSILGGKYPSVSADSETSMKLVTTFEVGNDIVDFGFSPSGEFLLVRTIDSYYTYDLEYSQLSSGVDCTAVRQSLGWINSSYLWSNCSGSLSIQEFDGQNSHVISPALIGQAVVLTRNGKYIYSIGKTANGYNLQRVRMILP